MADFAIPAGAAAPVTCKITALAAGGFQADAADMPLNCKLFAPDSKTQIVTVGVFNASDGSPVNGQPTNQTATSFSLALARGSYDVQVIVGSLPQAAPVRVVEACGAQTELVFINVLVANNGRFRLGVV